MSKLSCRASVYRPASSVRGQRHLLTTSMATSIRTIPMSQAASVCLPSQEATGMARMQPAKKAQAIVCSTLTATKARAEWVDGERGCDMNDSRRLTFKVTGDARQGGLGRE